MRLFHYEYARLGVKVSQTRFPGVSATAEQRNAGKQHFNSTSIAAEQDIVVNVSSWVAHVLQYNCPKAAMAMASLRREQKAELLIYDNAIPPLDMPAIRMRGYFWNIWRTYSTLYTSDNNCATSSPEMTEIDHTMHDSCVQ